MASASMAISSKYSTNRGLDSYSALYREKEVESLILRTEEAFSKALPVVKKILVDMRIKDTDQVEKIVYSGEGCFVKILNRRHPEAQSLLQVGVDLHGIQGIVQVKKVLFAPHKVAVIMEDLGLDCFELLIIDNQYIQSRVQNRMLFTIDKIRVLTRNWLKALKMAKAKGLFYTDMKIENMTLHGVIDLEAFKTIEQIKKYQKICFGTSTSWDRELIHTNTADSNPEAVMMFAFGKMLYELFIKSSTFGAFLPYTNKPNRFYHRETHAALHDYVFGFSDFNALVSSNMPSDIKFKIFSALGREVCVWHQKLREIGSYLNVNIEHFEGLLKGLLTCDRASRMTIDQALQHPFLKAVRAGEKRPAAASVGQGPDQKRRKVA